MNKQETEQNAPIQAQASDNIGRNFAHNVERTIQMMRAMTETVQELGSIPSGHLYANVMGHMSLDQYDRIIGILVKAKLVTISGHHVITWIGPNKVSKTA